jgi:hypothetical protein
MHEWGVEDTAIDSFFKETCVRYNIDQKHAERISQRARAHSLELRKQASASSLPIPQRKGSGFLSFFQRGTH